jgi:large subunit ribosomal protein L24
MKPTKMRNKQIYYATMQTTSSQLSGMLSKNLRKKYGKRSVRIVEGDSVKVIRGEFNGVDGKVTKVSASNGGLTIEGVKKEKLKGEKYDVFIHTSNIEITGLNTDDKWRINKLEGKNARTARPEAVKKDTQKELEVKEEKTSASTDKTTKQKKEMKK